MEEALLHGDASQGGSGQGAASRKVLGIKVSRTESIPTNASSHGHVSLNSASSISASRRQQGVSSIQRPNGKLTVYSDATSSSSSSAGAGAGRASSRQVTNRAIVEPWKDLGTEHIRRKENVHEATPWQGVTLPSDVPVPKKAIRKLEVFQDPIPVGSCICISVCSQHMVSCMSECLTFDVHMIGPNRSEQRFPQQSRHNTHLYPMLILLIAPIALSVDPCPLSYKTSQGYRPDFQWNCQRKENLSDSCLTRTKFTQKEKSTALKRSGQGSIVQFHPLQRGQYVTHIHNPHPRQKLLPGM